MRTAIKTKSGHTYSFWMPNSGGYVRLEGKNAEGTLAPQICTGGGFTGSTVSATPESFERVCKKWVKNFDR